MLNKVIEYDKNFNEALFLSKADHIFIMILNAILENDMTSVKHYLSDEVYKKFDAMVNSYKEKGITRIFDEMNVKQTKIVDTNIQDNKINITIDLTSRYMDYFIDENGNFVSGNNQSRIEKNHRIVLTKDINAKELKEARRCNHCGKTLDINATGVCPYCKEVIDISMYDYIVTQID